MANDKPARAHLYASFPENHAHSALTIRINTTIASLKKTPVANQYTLKQEVLRLQQVWVGSLATSIHRQGKIVSIVFGKTDDEVKAEGTPDEG